MPQTLEMPVSQKTSSRLGPCLCVLVVLAVFIGSGAYFFKPEQKLPINVVRLPMIRETAAVDPVQTLAREAEAIPEQYRQKLRSGSRAARQAKIHEENTARRRELPAAPGLVRFEAGEVSVATSSGYIPVSRLRESDTGDLFTPLDPYDDIKFRQATAGSMGEFFLLHADWFDARLESGRDFSLFLNGECSLFGPPAVAGIINPLLRKDGAQGGADFLRAGKYRDFVEAVAARFKLSPDLIYAIISTESNFNPMAISRSNALGLMQVVPESAGGEAHAFLTGSRGQPDTDVLFAPEQNIRYGAAYLHLLDKRHFVGVQDEVARELCIIAAYNGGPGAVLRVFDVDKDKAVERINSLTYQEVYAKLITCMPRLESRQYVDKVLQAMNALSHLNQTGATAALKGLTFSKSLPTAN